MSIFKRLLEIKEEIKKELAVASLHNESIPSTVLFFVFSTGKERAEIVISRGKSFEHCWQEAEITFKNWRAKHRFSPVWLRVELVNEVRVLSWLELKGLLNRSKRNYFRYGLSFDDSFNQAILEHEIYANALIYDNKYGYAVPNSNNLAAYGRRRFKKPLSWPSEDNQPVYLFKTRAFFTDGKALHSIEREGRNSGYRVIDNWGADYVGQVIDTSTDYLARQVKDSGEYHYGWFPCFDRPIPTYNALRHASSTYALIEGWEVTQEKAQKAAIERALNYLQQVLIKEVNLPDGTPAAFLVDVGDEIKLGGNAVCILAMAKYTEVTGDNKYLELMEKLALGILYMQNPDTGQLVHVLNYPDLSVKEEHRIIYYDGEAAFGLMRLYGITKDPRWINAVKKSFEYFIEKEHWRAHDHWLSYCVNELTLYDPDPKYYQFGLDNVRDHLDFVLNRLTTFPTLLELMMAAQRMITRLQETPDLAYLLEGFDIDKFYRALEHRARYLMNGFFYPEIAMFFKNPARVVGGFFIRHHTFRVRIDDVEHYLSGLVAYRKYLLANHTHLSKKKDLKLTTIQTQESTLTQQERVILAWGGDLNLGRRQHYRTAELGVKHVLNLPTLQNADLTLVNLECVIATKGEQGVDKGEGGPYYYRARPEMADVLLAAGVDVVATANNHAGDYGAEALLQQTSILQKIGIESIGSGRNRKDALQPLIKTIKGLNIALFSLDTTQPRFAATDTEPGIAYFDPQNLDYIKKDFSKLLQQTHQQAHVVLVALHYGANNKLRPTAQDRAVAHALIDAGADAVLGASAHRLQGIEIYKGRPIIHDAGDLLFDAVVRNPKDGGVFQLELSKDGVQSITFTPVAIGFGQSKTLGEKSAVAAIARYNQLCSEFGVKLVPTKKGCGYIRLHPNRRSKLISRDFEPVKSKQKIELRNIALEKDYTVDSIPKDAKITPIRLGPLVLVGLRVSPYEFTRRRMLWVESFWMLGEPVGEDIRLSFQAVPLQETKMPAWGRGMDHDPCDWMWPTSRWKPNKIYRDYYGLRPPYLKDWDDVDLQLVVALVAKNYESYHYKLPVFFKVIKNLKRTRYTRLVKYKEDIDSNLLVVNDNSKTWTARAIQEVVGGEWIVSPPDGWFVKSIVAGVSHIDLVDSPVMFAAHTSFDRARNEQSRIVSVWDNHHLIVKNVSKLAGALVSKEVSGLPAGFPILMVSDPFKAVIELGIANRQRLNCPVVAVTGSAGKTSATNMINSVIGASRKVYSTYDNYNSRCGIFITLASAPLDSELVVLETAVTAINSINNYHLKLLNPDIGVITNIGPSHMGEGMTLLDVARRKANIVEGINEGGYLIVCRDTLFFDYIEDRANLKKLKILTYGEHPDSDIRLIDYNPNFGEIEVLFFNVSLKYKIGAFGKHMAINSLICLALSFLLGLNIEQVLFNMRLSYNSKGRGGFFYSCINNNKVLIFDESYNANPISMKSSLEFFSSYVDNKPGRSILVLGDMLELGEKASEYHADIIPYVLSCKPYKVYLVGDEMHKLLGSMEKEGVAAFAFNSLEEIYNDIVKIVSDEDNIFFKSSNSIGLSKLVERIVKNS